MGELSPLLLLRRLTLATSSFQFPVVSLSPPAAAETEGVKRRLSSCLTFGFTGQPRPRVGSSPGVRRLKAFLQQGISPRSS